MPVVAGCDAGNNAPVENWHNASPGAYKVVHGALRINDMFVLGAPPDSTLAPGSSAGMFFALSNNGPPDRLIRISAPGAASSVTLPSGGITLGHQQSVFLTGPVPKVILQHLTRRLVGGQTIRVLLDFQNAGTVPMTIQVMPRAQFYATFSPVPSAPTATPAPGSTSGATPSPTVSSPGLPTATPSP